MFLKYEKRQYKCFISDKQKLPLFSPSDKLLFPNKYMTLILTHLLKMLCWSIIQTIYKNVIQFVRFKLQGVIGGPSLIF